MAPLLPFTADEMWGYLPPDGDREESVHLTRFPDLDERYVADTLREKWQLLLQVRNRVMKVLEEKRAAKVLGNALEAEIILEAPDRLFDMLQDNHAVLEDLFIVSRVTLRRASGGQELTTEAALEKLQVSVVRTTAGKCERCWKYSETVGESLDHPSICRRCAQVILHQP
jgi:isoleucyl-tRNA synthetase